MQTNTRYSHVRVKWLTPLSPGQFGHRTAFKLFQLIPLPALLLLLQYHWAFPVLLPRL
jgi:hypothetical protein